MNTVPGWPLIAPVRSEKKGQVKKPFLKRGKMRSTGVSNRRSVWKIYLKKGIICGKVENENGMWENEDLKRNT